MLTNSVDSPARRLAAVAVGIMLAGTAPALAQPKDKSSKSSPTIEISPLFEESPIVALEHQPGLAGEEWWRALPDSTNTVLLPPRDAGAPPAPDDRAQNCCPMGGWTQSLGFNPVWAGNVISMTEPAVLKEIQLEANFNGPLDITFGIYKEHIDGVGGHYSALCIRKVTLTGNGRGFYSSGPLNGTAGVTLTPKMENDQFVSTFFAVAVGWGAASIDFRVDSQTYPLSFCAGLVRGSFGQLGTNPPPPACPSSHEISNVQFFPTGAVSMRMCFEVPGGACCLGDRSCVDDLTANACTQDFGGEFLGQGTICALDGDQCSGFGACCLGGSCTISTPAACAGTYKGHGTECNAAADPCDPNKGACCNYDGTCELLNEYDCELDPTRDSPGNFVGVATCEAGACQSMGACCVIGDVENCTDTTAVGCAQYDCVNATGPDMCPVGFTLDTVGNCPPPIPPATQRCFRQVRTFSPGEPCVHDACRGPVGTCCFLGECSVESEQVCLNMGGVHTPSGPDAWQACEAATLNFCEDPAQGSLVGACCMPGNFCELREQAECTGAGGTFQGVGVACSQFICSPGACCYSSGGPQCQNGTLPLACAGTLGGQYQGIGSTCAGSSSCFDTGACCQVSGACSIISRTECLAIPDAQFQAGVAACEPTTCPVRGACCTGSGCQARTQAQCTAAGGVYRGDGVACSPQLCEFSACCNGGTCTNEFTADCVGQPGNPGEVCTPDLCVPGACCVDTVGAGDFTCTPNLTLFECRELGVARFFRPGMPCTPDPCVEPPGACCLPTGCEDLTETDCTAQAGVFLEGAACADMLCAGACCQSDGMCDDLTEGECSAIPGAQFLIDELCITDPCPELPGACCQPDGSCTEITSNACALITGAVFFEGDTCATAPCPGACCLPGDVCTNGTEADCDLLGGLFNAGADCATFTCPAFDGACCQTNGFCSEITSNACAAISGATFFDGDTCATAPCPGACCQAGNVCTNGTEAECDVLSGLFFAGEDCATFTCPVFEGACCELDGSCNEIDSNACALIPGATFFPGETCAIACPPPLGACCETNGFCSEITSNACAAISGATFSPGLTCGDIVCEAGCGLRINGDYDGDGDVDLVDYAWFQTCIGASSPECLCPFDLDPNGTIDLADFVIFVMVLSGDVDLSCVSYLDRFPGDFHQDGKIDLHDFAALQVCFDVAENDECRCIFDINEDGEIDLEDLPAFIDLIVGP